MDNRPDYLYLIEKFGKTKIQQRYDHMERRALEFLSENKLEGKAMLNHEMLNVVMLDYFADLERLKIFEEISRANKNKITAYMSYWWLRRKPIQVVTDSMDDEELAYLNEKFVVTLLAKDFMFDSTAKLLENEKCKKCLIHIYYHLKYRVFTAQTLELMLMAVDTGIEIGKLEISC